MPRNRRCFIHGTLVEICFRTEEGLPLVASPYMTMILEGIFARAVEAYSMQICSIVVMGNHIHLLVVVGSPEQVPLFVAYIKRETAHAINRLTGRIGHTVWQDGYDAVIILDSKKAIDRIVYLYTNPQKANLVDKIEDYPNLCTWKEFLLGGGERRCKRISRDKIPTLSKHALNLKAQEDLTREMEKKATGDILLYLEPDAWIDCFPELKGHDPEHIKNEIISLVREEEQRLNRERKYAVLGAFALRLQSIHKPFLPKKRGRRMLCMSTILERRQAFVGWCRDLFSDGTFVYKCWKQGDYRLFLPPGLFAPGGLSLANLIPNNVLLY